MRIDAKTMIEAIEAAGLEPTNYSGRGMYGRQCVSVSSDDGALHLLAEIIEALPQVADDDAQEDPTIMARLAADVIRAASTDSMGFGQVVYWPDLEWPADHPTTSDDEGEGE